METEPGTQRCGAQRRHEAGICRRPAGAGTSHRGTGRCSWHGGCAPSGEKAAAQEEAYEQARRQLARLNVPPVSDPVLALRKLGGQAQWWNETCAENLNRLRGGAALPQLGPDRADPGRGPALLGVPADLPSGAHVPGENRPGHLGARDRRERKAAVIVAIFATALAGARLAPELEQQVRTDFARGLRAVSAAESADGDDMLSGVVLPLPAPRPDVTHPVTPDVTAPGATSPHRRRPGVTGRAHGHPAAEVRKRCARIPQSP
jgi:hypothetical protein